MSSSPCSMAESVSVQTHTAQHHNTCRSPTHNAMWCVSHAPAPPTIAEALGTRLSIRSAASEQRFRCSMATQATTQTTLCACQCRTTLPAMQDAMPHLVSTTATQMPPCKLATLQMLVSDSLLMYLQANFAQPWAPTSACTLVYPPTMVPASLFTLQACESHDTRQQFAQESHGGSTVWRNIATNLAIDSNSYRNSVDNWIWACPGTNTAKYFNGV